MNFKQWKEILIETELRDVLTDKTYNENYSVEVRLTIKETREIADILKKIAEVISVYEELQGDSPDNLALPQFHNAMKELIQLIKD